MRLPRRHIPVSAGGTPRAATVRGAVALAATMALGAALLTACGDSAAGSDGTVTVGIAGNIFDVPLQVADARGYFGKRGLKVKFVTVTAATGTPSLESGSLQFLNASPTSFLSAMAQGIPQIAIGADGLGNPLGLVASKKFAQQHRLTAKTPMDQVAKALVGSTGGASSVNTQAEAGLFLKSKGVDSGKVHWVSLPNPSADKAALNNGQIDWFVTSEPLPLQIQDSGDGVVLANSLKVPQWSAEDAGYGQVVVARKSWAGQHAATTRKFAAAVQEATAYLNTHVADASVLPEAKKALPGIPDAVVQASLREVGWPKKDTMTKAGWDKTFTFVDSLGALTKNAEITSADWTNTYLP